MKAVDTNVVVRLIMRDDAPQLAIARRLLDSGFFVPLTVALETAWLLESRYALDRDRVAGLLLGIIDLPTVTVDDPALLQWALGRYAAGADIGDMVHLIASAGLDGFATFDKRIAAKAGAEAPVPIETLT